MLDVSSHGALRNADFKRTFCDIVRMLEKLKGKQCGSSLTHLVKIVYVLTITAIMTQMCEVSIASHFIWFCCDFEPSMQGQVFFFKWVL